MTKKELAINLHDKKYNCAQAVACAFADEVGVDMQTLFKACEGFGLGMGCMNGTCGAISGAVMLAGFQNSDGNIVNPSTKASTYQISKTILEKFEVKNKQQGTQMRAFFIKRKSIVLAVICPHPSSRVYSSSTRGGQREL